MPSAAKARKKPVITAEEIAEYVAINEMYNKSKGRREKLRERILEKIDAGAVCDAHSPYRLFILEIDKGAVDWRKLFEDQMAEYYPEDWQERVAKLEAENRRVERHLKVGANVPEALKIEEGV